MAPGYPKVIAKRELTSGENETQMNIEIQQQFEQLKTSWDAISNVPADLTGWGFPGLTRQEIADAIGGMATTAEQLSEREEFEPSATSKHALLQTIVNLRSYITQHIPSNPQPHIPGLLPLIEQARQTLRHWLEESDRPGKRAIPALTERLAEATSRIRDAEKLHRVLVEACEIAETSKLQLTKDAKSAETLAQEIKLHRTASAADAEETEKSRSRAIEDAEEINTQISEFKSLKAELVESQKTQQKLFTEFEAYRHKVDAVLADANRTGMAGSFITRKNELASDITLWRNVFALALIALAVLGFFYVAPSISAQKWEEVLLRLPITAPFVWLGWFAAKQYGYAIRLREDYAYKVASAMAFEGFKREVQEGDELMQQKLLETAVTNFGDNPLRIYNGHENHASPIHEILEKHLRDDKFIDLLKSAFIRIKG
jgi:hypothetical protein